MSLKLRQAGSVHIAYTQGDVHVPTEIEGDYNWSHLQSVLRWSLVSRAPSTISLADISTKDPNEPAITLTINVKQTSSARDSHPLTMCTAHTILGEGDQSIRVSMRADGPPTKYLLGDALPGVHMRYAEPSTDDWKTAYSFATIPPGPEGLTMKKPISCERILQYGGKTPSPDRQPQPGDEFQLYFTGGRRETFTDWWNWGDLENDLKDKKLIDLPNPVINPGANYIPLPSDVLLPFEAWDDDCDDDGKPFVRLLNILDTTPLTVRFTE